MTNEIDNGISGSSLQPAQWKLTPRSRPIEPSGQFHFGGTEPVLVISAGGKVTWMGKEVVGDEEFKQAMMDLNVKLGGINKTVQPAQEPVGYLIEYEHLSGTVNRGGSSRKFDEVWTLNSFLSEFEDAEIDATKWRNKKVSKVYTHPAPTQPALSAELKGAVERTRFDLLPGGSNYPDVRVLLAFAEAAIEAHCRGGNHG